MNEKLTKRKGLLRTVVNPKRKSKNEPMRCTQVDRSRRTKSDNIYTQRNPCLYDGKDSSNISADM